jgi:hypothetical protein
MASDLVDLSHLARKSGLPVQKGANYLAKSCEIVTIRNALNIAGFRAQAVFAWPRSLG